MQVSGWVEAFAYVWVIAALNLTYAFGKHIGVHPTAFILLAMFFGGIALLAIAKPGANPMRIILSPMTWLYGAATILTELFYYLMVLQIPPADASIFIRLNVAMSVILGWLFLKRTVGRNRLIGIAIISAAIVAAFAFIPKAQTASFVATAFTCAFLMASRNVFAEFHPWNRAAKTVIEKMRVTGLVVLTTAFFGMVFVLALWLLAEQGILPHVAAIPGPAAFTHTPTLVISLLLGGVIITLMQYLMFSSVVKITSENFFAVMALTIPATLVLQECAAALGFAGIPAGAWYLLPYIAVILLGTLFIVKASGAHKAAAPVPPAKTA